MSVWSTSDDLTDRQSKPLGANPVEAALTSTVILMRRVGERFEALLCNPSPASWNSWMFPYGSEKFPIPSDANLAAASHLDVETYVHRLASSEEAGEDSGRVRSMGEMVGERMPTDLTKFDTIFECKQSKTSGRLTLYVFEYYYSAVRLSPTPTVEHDWIDLGQAKTDPTNYIESFSTEHDRRVEANVSTALRSLVGNDHFKRVR